MGAARGARPVAVEDRAERVFDAVRAFLALHRLTPDPVHYAFGHHIVCHPDGPLAQSVATLTEGGIRLSARDIARLGGGVAPVSAAPAATLSEDAAAADGLVAQTQLQVEGFSDMVRSIRAEAADFGRDLAASADAVRGASGDDVVRLTHVMLDRVRSAEARLAVATQEAEQLRTKLAQARDDARRDPLTDLPNRRAFEEAFAAQATADGPVCLAVCDVDRFKRVNDQFGHSVGDRVLRAIADALRAACAPHFVARYGGEEFVVLFTGVDVATARATLETARLAVAAKRYRLRESDMPLGAVTFSAGLVAAEPDDALGAVFGRADKLLYKAKDDGRNRVRSA